MGRSLEEYGWTNPWQKPYWLNKQLIQAVSNPQLLNTCHSYDNIEEALKKADLLDPFPKDSNRERICVYDNMNNQFLSVFKEWLTLLCKRYSRNSPGEPPRGCFS
jgi:hypothetical protein